MAKFIFTIKGDVMFKYGKSSSARLATCHSDLQRLLNSLIVDYDVSILCGYRDKTTQNKAFNEGKSTITFPNSKHNSQPSLAVDAILYPVKYKDVGRNYMFAGIVKERARQLGIEVRLGADWNGNLITSDQQLHDLVHIELIN